MATKSLPDRIHVLVAVQPARLAMRVSQGDLRVLVKTMTLMIVRKVGEIMKH